MNKEYIYLDGKAIIIDEAGEKNLVEYYDNLDKVLVQENLIEEMENKLEEAMKAHEKKERYLKSQKESIVLPPIALVVTCFVFLPLLFNFMSDGNIEMVNTILGKMSVTLLMTLTMSTTTLPFFSFLAYLDYRSYKKAKKEKLGLESEIRYLTKSLEQEREELLELKSDKTIEEENFEKFQTVKVDDKEKLLMLRNYLSMYYDLGYNENEYYEYYKNGVLKEKLEDYYTEEEIQKIREQLEIRKGPVLQLAKTLGSRESKQIIKKVHINEE